MWANEALPRLQAIGLGADVAARTYRLAGVGESQVAELLGEDLLRSTNPVVATYARVEAVDVRISAVGDDHRSAASLVEAAAETVARHARSVRLGHRRDDLGRRRRCPPRRSRMDARRRRDRNGRQPRCVVRRRPWVRFDEVIAGDAPGGARPRTGRTRMTRTMARDDAPSEPHETGARRRPGPVRSSGAGAGRLRGRDRRPDARPYGGPRGFDRHLVAERRASRDTAGVPHRDGQRAPRGPRRCSSPPRKPSGAGHRLIAGASRQPARP